MEELSALVKRFDATSSADTAEEGQPWALTLAFYPRIYFPDDEMGD